MAACAVLAPRPLPPKVDVEAVRVAFTNTGEPRLRVGLTVHNPNAYPIAIQSIDARIRLEEQDVATATLPSPVTLVASGDTHVEVEARADFAAFGVAIDRALRRLAARYEVTGYAIVQDGRRLDFRKSGELSASALLGGFR